MNTELNNTAEKEKETERERQKATERACTQELATCLLLCHKCLIKNSDLLVHFSFRRKRLECVSPLTVGDDGWNQRPESVQITELLSRVRVATDANNTEVRSGRLTVNWQTTFDLEVIHGFRVVKFLTLYILCCWVTG